MQREHALVQEALLAQVAMLAQSSLEELKSAVEEARMRSLPALEAPSQQPRPPAEEESPEEEIIAAPERK